MQRNKALREAIEMCCTLLRKTTLSPTRCRELIHGWPDYMGICDASSFGVGRVIVGENRECTPIVFQLQWPPDITANVKSASNPNGMITNSDLEMAGLLLLLLVMEEVVCNLKEANVALFRDNTPTVGWVTHLASRHSTVTAQLIAALALCLKSHQCCPLTPLHIKGDANALTNIPSQPFGSVPHGISKLTTIYKKKSIPCSHYLNRTLGPSSSFIQMLL
jgi:hypothetical protein